MNRLLKKLTSFGLAFIMSLAVFAVPVSFVLGDSGGTLVVSSDPDFNYKLSGIKLPDSVEVNDSITLPTAQVSAGFSFSVRIVNPSGVSVDYTTGAAYEFSFVGAYKVVYEVKQAGNVVFEKHFIINSKPKQNDIVTNGVIPNKANVNSTVSLPLGSAYINGGLAGSSDVKVYAPNGKPVTVNDEDTKYTFTALTEEDIKLTGTYTVVYSYAYDFGVQNKTFTIEITKDFSEPGSLDITATRSSAALPSGDTLNRFKTYDVSGARVLDASGVAIRSELKVTVIKKSAGISEYVLGNEAGGVSVSGATFTVSGNIGDTYTVTYSGVCGYATTTVNNLTLTFTVVDEPAVSVVVPESYKVPVYVVFDADDKIINLPAGSFNVSSGYDKALITAANIVHINFTAKTGDNDVPVYESAMAGEFDALDSYGILKNSDGTYKLKYTTDTSYVITYTLTYEGNTEFKSEKTYTVNVVKDKTASQLDSAAPTDITIGSYMASVNIGDTFAIPTVTASDKTTYNAKDSNGVKIFISNISANGVTKYTSFTDSEIDIAAGWFADEPKINLLEITFTAEDLFGNTSFKTIKVIVNSDSAGEPLINIPTIGTSTEDGEYANIGDFEAMTNKMVKISLSVYAPNGAVFSPSQVVNTEGSGSSYSTTVKARFIPTQNTSGGNFYKAVYEISDLDGNIEIWVVYITVSGLANESPAAVRGESYNLSGAVVTAKDKRAITVNTGDSVVFADAIDNYTGLKVVIQGTDGLFTFINPAQVKFLKSGSYIVQYADSSYNTLTGENNNNYPEYIITVDNSSFPSPDYMTNALTVTERDTDATNIKVYLPSIYIENYYGYTVSVTVSDGFSNVNILNDGANGYFIPEKVGKYTVTYHLFRDADNSKQTLVYSVYSGNAIKPVIVVDGVNASFKIDKDGSVYTLKPATATDKYEGIIPVSVKVLDINGNELVVTDGKVKFVTSGTYEIIYSAVDGDGIITEVSKTIYVSFIEGGDKEKLTAFQIVLIVVLSIIAAGAIFLAVVYIVKKQRTKKQITHSRKNTARLKVGKKR